jgi:hypothetical protein
MKTIKDLKRYATMQARRCSSNYIGAADSWRQGTNERNRLLYKIKKNFKSVWNQDDLPLIPGKYGSSGRLRIEADSIRYVPGQYAPNEIYWRVLAYFEENYS